MSVSSSEWEVTDGDDSDASSGVDIAQEIERETDKKGREVGNSKRINTIESSTSPVIVSEDEMKSATREEAEEQEEFHIPSAMMSPLIINHFDHTVKNNMVIQSTVVPSDVDRTAITDGSSMSISTAEATLKIDPATLNLNDQSTTYVEKAVNETIEGSESKEDDIVEDEASDSTDSCLLDFTPSPPQPTKMITPEPLITPELIAAPVPTSVPLPAISTSVALPLVLPSRPAPPLLPPPPAPVVVIPSPPSRTSPSLAMRGDDFDPSPPASSSSFKPFKYFARSNDSTTFHSDVMLPTLGQALLGDGISDHSDIDRDNEKKNAHLVSISASANSSLGSTPSKSGGSSSTSSSSSSSFTMLNSHSHTKSLPNSALFEPDRCYCCRLSWMQRILGFSVSISTSAILFILVRINRHCMGKRFTCLEAFFFLIRARLSFCFLVSV